MARGSRQRKEAEIECSRFAHQRDHRRRRRQHDTIGQAPLTDAAPQFVDIMAVPRAAQGQVEFGPPGGNAVDRRLEAPTGRDNAVVEHADWGCGGPEMDAVENRSVRMTAGKRGSE